MEREGSQSGADIESDGSFEEVAVFGEMVSERRGDLDWRGVRGQTELGSLRWGR